MNAESNPPQNPSARARVQLNGRIPAELDDRMRRFQFEQRTTRQDLVEHALTEYLNRHEKKKRE